MTAAPNSSAAWEHTLPYRVLIEELRMRRPDVVPDNVDRLLDKVDLAAKKVKELRERDEPDLEQYNAALKECAACEQPLKNILHKAQLNALCFSGGGIRSASFGLGVLWQLARQSWSKTSGATQASLLNQLDYVSTVSGGGYVGSWLTGWTKRHPQGLDGVIRELATPAPTSADPEPAPVRHLRDYTSYLAPRSGLLSPDMWTLAAIFLRNLLLNWAILVPTVAALLFLPVLNTYGLSWAMKQQGAATGYLWAAVVFALIALAYTAWKLPGNYKVQPKSTNFTWCVGAPVLLSAWLLSAYYLHEIYFEGDPFEKRFWRIWALAGAAHAGLLLGRIAVAAHKKGTEYVRSYAWAFIRQGLVAVPSSAFAAWMLWLLASRVGPVLTSDEDIRLFASLALPAIWATFALAMVLLNGLSAKFDAEEDREWWSRSGAYLLLTAVAWPLVHLLVLYSREIKEAAEHVFFVPGKVSIPVLTALIGALASLAGFSPATASSHTKVDFDKLSRTGKFLSQRKLLVPALGLLFFVLLAIALSLANDWICRRIGRSAYPADIPTGAVWIGLLCAGALALIMNLFVNVNTFSLHAMYRGRLVRSYLGASNNRRRPNPFINFDPNDNFPMKEAPATQSAPLHIVNMALNLVSSKKLAWQQRKAESFTVSALQSGSFRVGYQPTAQYGGASGLTLGTAMAISGAAASPNMGYHSNPILSLVMTFFNARLGWWLPNPGPKGRLVWRKSGPVFSLGPLLNESLGRTTDENQWVYLSDGGHFENLALYEMVLRRCQRIIVVDGSADAGFNMEDLGNAVRKIFIDLGVPIEFDVPPAFAALPKTSLHHCYLATICYSHVDGTRKEDDGRLLYIKASLTGQEPADVAQYAKAHPDFPHETTANQFFNESQFESYVRLGSDVIDQLVKQGFPGGAPSPMGMLDLFTAAGDKPRAAAAGTKP